MTIDTETPQTPGWQLSRIAAKIADRSKALDDLYARYEDREGHAAKRASITSESARRFFDKCRTNWAEMIVRAVRYRMRISAIRTKASTSDYGDDVAWRLFNAKLAGIADDVHRNMLIAGSSYVIVGTPGGELAVTAEDPRQVATMHDPLDQSRVLYAAKFFHDAESDINYAYLFTPDRVHVAFLPGPRASFSNQWGWDESRGGEEGVPHGMPRCPVVRFRNEESVGEFERHRPLLDRIDHFVLQGMVIATLQAFKQRAIKVDPDEMPEEDEDGEPVDYEQVFITAPDKMWKIPKTAEIWESGNVDLTPIYTGTEKSIQQLSAVTFTPLSMFTPEGQNQSAEGASLAREGMVTKTEDRIARAGQNWAIVMALAFHALGDTERADASWIQVEWDPAERFGISEKYSAAVQAKAAGVPFPTIARKILQFTPQEIARAEAERMSDMLSQLVAEAQASEPAPVG